MTDEVSWAKPFASAHARAQWAIYLLIAGIVMALISVGSTYLQIGLLSRIVAGEAVTRTEATANDSRELVVNLSRAVVYLATVVFFLIWIHRAYRNLPALGVRHPEYSPGWAVGYFFIPFANLVRPYQVVREIWHASEPDTTEAEATPFHFAQAQSIGAPTLIKAWWLLWIVWNVASNLPARLTGWERNSPADLVSLSWMTLVAYLLGIPAAILAILVIKNIDRMQEEKSQRLTAVATAVGLDSSQQL